MTCYSFWVALRRLAPSAVGVVECALMLRSLRASRFALAEKGAGVLCCLRIMADVPGPIPADSRRA